MQVLTYQSSVSHQKLCHTQKMRLCRTNKQTDFPGVISLLAVGLLPQPLVEFKMTHCVDIGCTNRNHSQWLPPNPLIFQQIHKVLRLLPLRKLILLEHCYICAPSRVVTPGEQQGKASVSLNLSNLVKQLCSVVSHCSLGGILFYVLFPVCVSRSLSSPLVVDRWLTLINLLHWLWVLLNTCRGICLFWVLKTKVFSVIAFFRRNN